MNTIRWSLSVVAMAALVFSGAISAHAEWGFSLGTAQNAFLYGYYGQMGNNGFFGRYDVDNSATGDFAPLNAWVGNTTDLNELAAGAIVSSSQLVLNANPRVVSDWFKLQGRYSINVYQQNTTQGAYTAMSPGQLTLWSFTARTPVVEITYGKKEFDQGFGLQFPNTRTEEYLLFSNSYTVPDVVGMASARAVSAWPTFRYGDATREADQKEQEEFFGTWADGVSKPYAEEEEAVPGQQIEIKPEEDTLELSEGRYAAYTYENAALRVGLGFVQRETIPFFLRPGWNDQDVNAAPVTNVIALIGYESKDLTIGAGGLRLTYHEGPELQRTAFRRLNSPTHERYETEGWVFLKYNNGRFFFLTELDWFNRLDRFQRSSTGFTYNVNFPDDPAFRLPEIIADGSGRNRFAPEYRESWRFIAETGLYFGTTAFRLFYSHMPGPDRRHGILIDRQPFIQDDTRQAKNVFEPYSILLSYQYGGGVDAPAHLSDANVYGAKLDYALAANLWLQWSVMHARRVSHGYGWGYIRPSVANFGTVTYGQAGTFANPSPAIPDNDLGWEFTVGTTWKLLEGWGLTTRFAWWQPGEWFKYACVDREVPGWETPSAANNWGVNPNRDIDPVIGFEVTLGATY